MAEKKPRPLKDPKTDGRVKHDSLIPLIADQMNKRGMTIQELARKIDKPASSTHNYLSGRSDPPAIVAKHMAYELRMSVERFIEILEEFQAEKQSKSVENPSPRCMISSIESVSKIDKLETEFAA